MKTLSSLLLASLLLTTHGTGTEDLRSKVAPATRESKLTPEIDPDRHIYGIPLGTSEDEFMTAHGKPSGYVRLRGEDTLLIYGKTHGFLFRAGKLAGVRITHHILDWTLSEQIPGDSPFDRIEWKLTNGITDEMDLTKVKDITGDKLSDDEHRPFYETDRSRVRLDAVRVRFESSLNGKSSKSDYVRVGGIYITPRE